MTVIRWTGVEVRALREALRRTQEEFAARTGFSASVISKWERARTGFTLRGQYAEAMDTLFQGLGADQRERFAVALGQAENSYEVVSCDLRGSDTGFPSVTIDPKAESIAVTQQGNAAEVIKDEDDDVRRRQFLGAVAAATVGETTQLRQWRPPQSRNVLAALPVRVEGRHVARVRAVNATLSDLSSRSGGCAALDAAVGALSWGEGLLNSDIDRAIHDELIVAVASLAITTGWACHDSGKQRHARAYLAQALDWLGSMEDRPPQADSLIAFVLFSLGRVSLHEFHAGRGSVHERADAVNPEHLKDALRYVQLGQIAAQDANDAGVQAQLHATAAWSYALMGRNSHVVESLSRAEHAMGRVDLARLEPWHKVFFSAGDWDGHRGLVHGVLADAVDDRTASERLAAQAVEFTTRSLSTTDPNRPARSLVYDRLVMAACQFRVGDLDPAVANTRRVLDDIDKLHSMRAVERLPQIVSAAEPFATNSTVADVVHDITLASTP